MTDFPSHLPTGDIREIFPDIFFVTGQMVTDAGADTLHYSRNMAIIRDPGGLTLLNTVRLDTDGFAALEALGAVRHIVRLGAFHGRDDAFYLQRYDACFWAMSGTTFTRGEAISDPLGNGLPGPCAGSTVFTFDTPNAPEAILHLDRHGGILITCDSLQNITKPDQFFNAAATTRMRADGFLKPANIGPGWCNAADPRPEDFARLKRLAFKHVLSGHGAPRLEDAYVQYCNTFSDRFGV